MYGEFEQQNLASSCITFNRRDRLTGEGWSEFHLGHFSINLVPRRMNSIFVHNIRPSALVSVVTYCPSVCFASS